MTTDRLLAAADRATTVYFSGEFKTRDSIRQAMEDLRVEVRVIRKELGKADTQRIARESH
jgi:hypothetical protein